MGRGGACFPVTPLSPNQAGDSLMYYVLCPHCTAVSFKGHGLNTEVDRGPTRGANVVLVASAGHEEPWTVGPVLAALS